MTNSRKPSQWGAFAVGLLLVSVGLAGLLCSVPYFGDFAHGIRTESRELTPMERTHFKSPSTNFFGGGHRRDASTGMEYVDIAGFEAGAEALFCMLLFSLGLGISARPFLEAGGRQRLSLVLGVVWHGFGMGTCACYLLLAPSKRLLGKMLIWIGRCWTLLWATVLAPSDLTRGHRSR